MSIVTETQRILQAKSDLKAAIESRGGVFDTDLIDSFAEKLNGCPFAVGGTFTPENDTYTFSISNLAFKPETVYIVAPDLHTSTLPNIIKSYVKGQDLQGFLVFNNASGASTVGHVVPNTTVETWTDTGYSITTMASVGVFKGGYDYKYVVTGQYTEGGGDVSDDPDGYNQGYSDGYSVGYDDGYDIGYDEGYDVGKSEGGGDDGGDSYYDTFWDSYLPSEDINGEYIFAGCSWNDDTFAPNKNIKPTWACSMFENCRITDLDGILKNKGVVLDTSNCINFSSMFYGSTITKLGVIDLSGCYAVGTRFSSMFRNSTLQSIEKIILLSKDFAYNNAMFANASSLTHVIFEGTIYQSFIINASDLDLESAKSVLLALYNHSGTDKEFTYKISLSSRTWAVLDADGNTAPGDVTWKEYVYNIGWNC